MHFHVRPLHAIRDFQGFVNPRIGIGPETDSAILTVFFQMELLQV